MAQFFRLYANRVPANLFDRLRYIIQVCVVPLHSMRQRLLLCSGYDLPLVVRLRAAGPGLGFCCPHLLAEARRGNAV